MSAATISCPWCAKGIEVNPNLQAGSQVHCPRCGAGFAVLAEDLRAAALVSTPPTSRIAEAPAPAPLGPALLPDADSTRLAGAAPPAARAWPLILTACAATALLLMAAAVAGVAYLGGKRPPQLVVVAPPAPPTEDDPIPPPPVLLQSRDDHPSPAPKPAAEPTPPVPLTPPTPATPPVPPTPPIPPPTPPAPPVQPPDAPPPVVEPPHPPAKPAPAGFKRRDQLAEEDLRKQLLQVQEVALDAPGDVRGANILFNIATVDRARGQAYPGPAPFARERPDLNGLPLATGVDCQLGKEPAENLQALSRKMRATFAACLSKDALDPRPDADALRQRLLDDDGKQWLTPDAIPCLLQMLQPENKPVRLILVEALGRIPGKRATQALAMRAMVDLAPEVREAAVKQLRDRPLEDSREILLHGLRYPWAPVIDHAAEALIALDDKEAAPSLVPLLDLPDPSVPILVKKDKAEVKAIPELVRINHLRNCVLCHSPSLDKQDLVRGAVPAPGKPLPAPATTPQYYETGERFVRADVTYLRQDFSVMQPVANPGVWPDYQRFDYFVHLRRPKMSDYETTDRKSQLGDESREAVVFALRELTGRDGGTTAASWQTALGKPATADPAAPPTDAGGDWRQFQATLQPGEDAALSTAAEHLTDKVLSADGRSLADIIRGLAEGSDPAAPTALARAIPFLKDAGQTQARDALADRLGRLSEADLRERLDDDDPEIRRAAARACAHREDKGKSLTAELIPLVADENQGVVEAAHAVLTAATGQDFGPAAGAAPADREKARAAWEAWRTGAKGQ